MPLTPAERKLRASSAANARWARSDPAEASETARRRIEERFGRQVDPDNLLDPADRARRAERAKRSYFAALALKSSKARRRRREAAAEDNLGRPA